MTQLEKIEIIENILGDAADIWNNANKLDIDDDENYQLQRFYTSLQDLSDIVETIAETAKEVIKNQEND